MKKIIPVTRPLLPDFDEYVRELKDVWDSQYLTNYGPKHQKLEQQLLEYLKVDNLSLFTNGHLALQTALRALELHGEIITTPFTYASTTHAIVECGCTPVFCDIDPVSLTIDVDKIENLITEKTVAILAVHVYGTACDVVRLQQIADQYHLKLLFDAAHTFGMEIADSGIGKFGDISMFSFHATKVFNTIEGGCLTYKDPSLKNKIEAISAFGFQKGCDSAAYVGTNAKMTEVSAAMGICNLRHVSEAIERRRLLVEEYNRQLENLNGLKTICKQPNVKSNYSYYPIIIDPEICHITRDIVSEELQKRNIIPRKYFYPLVSDFQ